ncbi:hypothetical protein K491DRAFT_109396 [Lophiostoma macrostomum CBS 122681]|uniref:Uncharacterized protein n=1 Tax=Lophiostoma macrostomum CBS 122681 TaxID=1314788 RepID=A0A6A6TMC2_9PLEO|nr:hypothetical protein K491DRAFT_109396 [Lophiostoma macrostomum CBS 122681]
MYPKPFVVTSLNICLLLSLCIVRITCMHGGYTRGRSTPSKPYSFDIRSLPVESETYEHLTERHKRTDRSWKALTLVLLTAAAVAAVGIVQAPNRPRHSSQLPTADRSPVLQRLCSSHHVTSTQFGIGHSE